LPPLLHAATEQVRAIVISDESVREAQLVSKARVAAAGCGPAGSLAQLSVEGVFIAQLHNRALLLNDGFQVAFTAQTSYKITVDES
jgi:hypothetical protein